MTPDNFREKNTLYTPMFAGINDAEYKLTDMIPQGTFAKNGKIKVQKLTAEGSLDGTVWYWCDYYDEDDEETYYGWMNNSRLKTADITFKKGEAFWMNVPEGSSVTFTFNGQVSKGQVVRTLNQGNTPCGNPFPATIAAKNLRLGGTFPTNGKVKFQKLTAEGGLDGTIWYWCDYYDEDDEETYYGWMNNARLKECDVSLAPGEGIWVNSPVSTSTLIFPEVIAE